MGSQSFSRLVRSSTQSLVANHRQDLCNTADLPTTCGSYAFKQGRPKKDANLINTLKEVGLIILAKANLSVSPIAQTIL